MKARQLIGNASFDPDALKLIFRAFDKAWEELAPKHRASPLAIEAARLKLANTILRLASENSRDAEQLATAALRIMSVDEPT